MTDFNFPIQGEPAPSMPFEPLTGNSRRSEATQLGSKLGTSGTTFPPAGGKENTGTPTHLPTSRHVKPSPCTPEQQVKPIRVIEPGPVRDDLPSLADLLAWRNPAASFCAMLFGTGTCVAARIAGASVALAFMLALNFVRSTFSSSWLKSSAWSGSDFEAFLQHRSKDCISFLMLARDELMCSENPWVMLWTCATLGLIRTVSYYTNFWSLMAVAWSAMFVLAPFKDKLWPLYTATAKSTANVRKAISDKLHLDRLSKVCWVAISGLAAAFVSDMTSKAFLALAFLMFIRCSMKKSEVEAVQTSKLVRSVASSHILRSAFHASERAGSFADDVLMSALKSARRQLEATPSHSD